MADTNIIPGNLDVGGDLRVIGQWQKYFPRTGLVQDDFTVFPIPLESFRVWDSYGTQLAATASSDDLGLYVGSGFSVGMPYLGTSDLKATGTNTYQYARTMFMIPWCYQAGESVRLRVKHAMLNRVADVGASTDFEVYKSNRDTTKTGSDLCVTANSTTNSLTSATADFYLSPATLSPGDWLDIRLTLMIRDNAGVTATYRSVTSIELHCDVKG